MLSIYIPPPEHEKMVVPEVILPSQVSARFHALARGEHQLLRALLEQAIDCYQKHVFATNRRDRRLFAEAEEWLMSDDVEASFSYRDVCDFLGLDVDSVREALLQWRGREEHVRRRPAAA